MQKQKAKASEAKADNTNKKKATENPAAPVQPAAQQADFASFLKQLKTDIARYEQLGSSLLEVAGEMRKTYGELTQKHVELKKVPVPVPPAGPKGTCQVTATKLHSTGGSSFGSLLQVVPSQPSTSRLWTV